MTIRRACEGRDIYPRSISMSIRVTVWGENVHEQKNKVVAEVYPKTMHGTIAEALNRNAGIKATTVTLQDPEHGMTVEKLAETDVLIWWGHAGERERIWVTSRQHPIAAGLPDHFELETEEMYGEPFGVSEPLETVFISWFAG